jgi:hypothetical protein
VLLNPAVLVVSGLSDVLGAIGQILLSYLVHMHSRLRSSGHGQVHVGPITWRFCHKKFIQGDPEGIVEWIAKKLKLLKKGDFCAFTDARWVAEILEKTGCEHIKAAS